MYFYKSQNYIRAMKARLRYSQHAVYTTLHNSNSHCFSFLSKVCCKFVSERFDLSLVCRVQSKCDGLTECLN